MLLKIYIDIIPYGNKHDVKNLNWYNLIVQKVKRTK